MANTETETTELPKLRREKNWIGVLFQIYVHTCILYTIFYIPEAKLLTNLFALFLILYSLLGVTCGAHRLWSHNSYSAHTTLRVILMFGQTLVGQGTIYDWVLEHRLHHKFHGTDDDPFNYKRGFFYAHLGHKMLQKNPQQKELEKEIDMTDIQEDKIVMFQKKYYWLLYVIGVLLLPINAPVEYWGDSILNSVMIVGILRYAISLHLAWLVNSARCIWALKLNDRFYQDSNLVYFLKKSYWHEYHYNLPWDYKTGEFGDYDSGCSTTFIKIWQAVGWAYGLRTIESDGVRRALEKAADTGKCLVDCINEEEQTFRESQPSHFAK